MTNYEKLVEALRCCIPNPPEKCVGCTYNIGNNECAVRRMMLDAAAAIEALQAENPIVESVLVDKMRQQMEETVCHCNVKENAELIARILDDDVDGKVFELPKRGKWITIRLNNGGSYTGCSCCEAPIPTDTMLDYIPESESKYCYSCGAKMTEAQDA